MIVELGIDRVMADMPAVLRGRKIGLISNYTVVDQDLRPTIDRFMTCSDLRLTTLFGPEHGVKNSAREGERVDFSVDAHSGLPAYSLYGTAKKPGPEMLANLDVLVLDLQDVGSRYYTNMNTMALAMEAASEHQKAFVVLDRPNPIGGVCQEGYIVESKFESFVGGGPMPNRHGMTMGELALWFRRIKNLDVDLTVVPMRGWERSMYWEETGLPFVSPSPNTTHADMTLLYPGLCLFEGTNVSLGRGTPHPFEVIGAPFLDGHRLAEAFNRRGIAGVAARATYFVPYYSQYQGELCAGIQLHIRDRRTFAPVRAAIELIAVLQELYPEAFAIVTGTSSRPSFFQLLAGTDKLETWLANEPRQAASRYLTQETEAWATFHREFEDIRLY